jgi:hypothetical protein
MEEVLTNTAESQALAADVRFYEMHLYDSGSAGERAYSIREAHARWNASIQYVQWDDPEIKSFTSLLEAKEHYAARKLALSKSGFIYSDMDWVAPDRGRMPRKRAER